MQPTQRYIRADVARQVRQECFFGCVICGSIPCDYDHFEVEFKDAEEHDASRIALLCGGCHRQKTPRTLSTARVKQARANPYNKTHDVLYRCNATDDQPVEVRLGSCITRGPRQATFGINSSPFLGAAVGRTVSGESSPISVMRRGAAVW